MLCFVVWDSSLSVSVSHSTIKERYSFHFGQRFECMKGFVLLHLIIFIVNRINGRVAVASTICFPFKEKAFFLLSLKYALSQRICKPKIVLIVLVNRMKSEC